MHDRDASVKFRKNVSIINVFTLVALWITGFFSGQSFAQTTQPGEIVIDTSPQVRTEAEKTVAESERFAHGLAMHGAPALPPGFAHLPYAEPDAPQGGRAVYGDVGGFDNLNPFIIRGRSIWALRELVFESLLGRSADEPFTLYGLLAEDVWTPPDRSGVAFRLRPEARFSDGSPVTIDDVVWSMETLRDQGRPNFGNMYGQIAEVERFGERGVRFVFEEPNRELPLLIGLMPILSKASWEGRDFSRGGLEPPIATGPYVVENIDPGRGATFRRNPEYWGAALAINKGRFNLDQIDQVYFRDAAALWEAFKAGKVDFYIDGDPANWAEGYDFPAAQDGSILREEIPRGVPSGMRGFVFNARRTLFNDRRIRAALALAFDFEWLNARFYRGEYQRIESYFSGSDLGFAGAATGEEKRLLEPFAAELPPETLETGWRPPVGAGDGRNRRNLRAARRLLEEAGWSVSDGALKNAAGEVFAFEILVRASEDERIAKAFADMLAPLGVRATPRFVDRAQYEERLADFDYDMIASRWYASLSPGEEQRHYWGSAAATAPGSRNYMGVEHPAIDAMIDALLRAEDRPAFEAAARALDRVLASGVYVIPFGYLAAHRVAWRDAFDKPAVAPLQGYRREVWWRRPEAK